MAALLQSARVQVRRGGAPDPEGRCVLYWMQRALRAGDNPALDVAVAAGNALGLPVVVFVSLVESGTVRTSWRHFSFFADALPELQAALAARRVGFVLGRSLAALPALLAQLRPALLVGDENWLREGQAARQKLAGELQLPFWTVDADVIVPTRLLGKEQFSARVIRPRIQARLPEYLRRSTDPAARVEWHLPDAVASLDANGPFLDELAPDVSIDRAVAPAKMRGGAKAAQAALDHFLRARLDGYATTRALPEQLATSQLSPYLRFGQLGPIAVALAVQDALASPRDKDAYLEQLIVRRELAVNFVRYNGGYDRLAGCEPWARYTLRSHLRDRRPRALTVEQLERGESPDPLWNAAQKEMVATGFMHGYMRMYWAKKLLEWCKTPDEAFAVAVDFNDRYELDGRDPNGYAGIAWALGGKHDRAWGPERSIFGKVRYMSLESTSRKFDAKGYIARVEKLVKT